MSTYFLWSFLLCDTPKSILAIFLVTHYHISRRALVLRYSCETPKSRCAQTAVQHIGPIWHGSRTGVVRVARQPHRCCCMLTHFSMWCMLPSLPPQHASTHSTLKWFMTYNYYISIFPPEHFSQTAILYTLTWEQHLLKTMAPISEQTYLILHCFSDPPKR